MRESLSTKADDVDRLNYFDIHPWHQPVPVLQYLQRFYSHNPLGGKYILSAKRLHPTPAGIAIHKESNSADRWINIKRGGVIEMKMDSVFCHCVCYQKHMQRALQCWKVE